MSARSISILVLLVLFSSVAFAQQIFKWKDKKGQWHYSDAPPPGVTAEKVRGLDISPKSSPTASPLAKPSKSPPAGTRIKEEAASKLPDEQPSDVIRKDIPSGWILSSRGIPWKSFDSEEACERYKRELIDSTTRTLFYGGSVIASSLHSGSLCLPLDELQTSKEADVILVRKQLDRGQSGVSRHLLAGRVFNRGQTTAKNVIVKYQVRNAQGTTVRKGEIRTVPHDIAGLTFAEFHGEIRGGAGINRLKVETEVDWSRE